MTNENDLYIPVSCDQHSEYELAIMHKLMLQLVWTDQKGEQHIAKVMPLNLKTQAREEFLIGKTNDGEIHFIRLDKISSSDVSTLTKG